MPLTFMEDENSQGPAQVKCITWNQVLTNDPLPSQAKGTWSVRNKTSLRVASYKMSGHLKTKMESQNKIGSVKLPRFFSMGQDKFENISRNK